MDEVCGRVEPSEAGDRWGGARGRGAEPRGLEEEERDGREEQEDRPPPRHQPHRSLPQATPCRLPPYSARSPCRCRRSTVVVGDRDGDASDRRRRHREGSGGEMVAVVGLPFSGWVGSWPGKREPNQGGPIYNASALWRATGRGHSKFSHSTAVGDIWERSAGWCLAGQLASALTCLLFTCTVTSDRTVFFSHSN